MTVTVTIDNIAIFNELNKLSQYVGSKEYVSSENVSASLYAIVKLKQQDSPLIDIYIRDVLNKLQPILNEYLISTDANTGILNFNMPTEFPNYAIVELQEECALYVINACFGLWLDHKKIKEDSAKYIALSSDNANKIKELLYTRNKPSIPATHVTP